ncbi:hypothetical protein LR013_00505 [candidate division NPL-UPA2 bacterium]|nr:hypothetical protein [candidate division NPL-UPA2 bacterium]
MKRLLLLYIFERSGHHLAALAIERALRELEGSGKVLTVDSLSYTNPRLNQVVQRSYLSLLHNAPEVWNYLYDNPKVARKIAGVKEFINKLSSNRLEKLLDSFSPQAVICTQAFPCGVVAAYKEKRRKNIPLMGVITDYIAHCYWLYDQVDFYAVPHETTKRDLLRKGVAEKKIRITGIPIDPKFGRKQDGNRIAERVSLSPNLPTVLIMGGGQGLGPVEEIVCRLDALTLPFQMIVVTGLNKSLRRDLKKRESRMTKPVHIVGYVDNIEELMEISDIIVSKPGGLTSAEALAKSLAIVIANCLPGQEERNSQFLVDEGVAIKVDEGKGIAAVVEELLRNSQRLSSLQAKARGLSRPDASSEIAKIALETVA